MNIVIEDSEIADYLIACNAKVIPRQYPDGTVIGDWRVLALLGSGGNGEVYRVVRTSDEFAAALKIAHGDARASERLSKEVKFLNDLEGSLFPRVFDDGFHGGRRYFVMELLSFSDLPESDTAVARYALGVCRAVARLHEMGMVHRDIKPRNILVRDDGTPVLIDFGLARRISGAGDLPGDVTIMEDGGPVAAGTPRFAAPEQWNGGGVGVAADIHGIGVTINDCFCGKVPRAWSVIVRRATSSIPEQRYQSVDELARSIRRRHLLRTVFAVTIPVAAIFVAMLLVRAWWIDSGRENCRWRNLCTDVKTADGCETLVRLSGMTNSFERTIRLRDGRYRIVGPGVLCADIFGSSNVFLRLERCVVQNLTTMPPPFNDIRYFVDDGVYLNFANLDAAARDRVSYKVNDCAYSTVRFRGPATLAELRAEKMSEFQKRVNLDRQRNLLRRHGSGNLTIVE